MAHMATDGKKFTNRPPMMAHNRMLERQQGMSKSEHDPLEQPAGEGDGGEEQDGSQIAQEHGPAVEVNVMHNHEAGHHAVHSKHPDGHEHVSDHHESAEAAHEHAKKLAMSHEEPDGDEGMEEPEYE
jgi:hypothetical protein